MRILVIGVSGLLGVNLALTGVVHTHPLVGAPFAVCWIKLPARPYGSGRSRRC